MRPTREQLLDHVKKEISEISEDFNSQFRLLTIEQREIVNRLGRLKQLIEYLGDCFICEDDCPDGIPLDLLNFANNSGE